MTHNIGECKRMTQGRFNDGDAAIQSAVDLLNIFCRCLKHAENLNMARSIKTNTAARDRRILSR